MTKEKDLFRSNNIEETVEEIKKALDGKDYISILFPLYIPGNRIWSDKTYSVVGKRENHARIVELLKEQGIYGKKMRTDTYVFSSKPLTEEILTEVNNCLMFLYD